MDTAPDLSVANRKQPAKARRLWLIVGSRGHRLAAWTADQQQQRQAGEDDTQHQREVVIIGNHCRLPGDLVSE